MTTTGIIITKTFGQNTFTFNVGEMLTNKGSKKFVFVEQVTVLPLVGLKRTTFQAMLNNQNPNKTNFKDYD